MDGWKTRVQLKRELRCLGTQKVNAVSQANSVYVPDNIFKVHLQCPPDAIQLPTAQTLSVDESYPKFW